MAQKNAIKYFIGYTDNDEMKPGRQVGRYIPP